MAYATYTTNALVCGTFNRNTADRSYLLFTRDLGMVYANARSVREERSRQRYALQDFSSARVTLIRGKQTWRVGSIEPDVNYYHIASDKAARGSVVGVFRLLRRFVKGEVPDEKLFDQVVVELKTVVGVLSERRLVEEVVYLKLLALLGYVDTTRIPDLFQIVETERCVQALSKNSKEQVEKLYVQAVTMSHL